MTPTFAPKILASTMVGEIVVSDGVVYVLSTCCKASHKGAESGAVCRACYAPISGPEAGWAALASDEDGRGEATLADLLRPSIQCFAEDAARRIFEAARGAEVAA